jgi:DNA invertase Pin-like site-specific DNA recombinase
LARKRKRVEAVGYVRTSSAANIGPDKDSEQRQRAAIDGYAKRAGFDVIGWFHDPAISGADPIEARPGFSALLDRIEGNGVRVVLVEDASRFARDLITQELGLLALGRRGVRVVTSTGDDMTDTSDPARKMTRQVAGAFHEYEKARLVAKLRAARERTGRLGGRKSYADGRPDVVLLARQLRAEGHSYRKIAHELAQRGYLTGGGLPFPASAIQKMVSIGPPTTGRVGTRRKRKKPA